MADLSILQGRVQSVSLPLAYFISQQEPKRPTAVIADSAKQLAHQEEEEDLLDRYGQWIWVAVATVANASRQGDRNFRRKGELLWWSSSSMYKPDKSSSSCSIVYPKTRLSSFN